MRCLFYFLCTLLLSSCSAIKTIKVLKRGSTSTAQFREVIPFETRAGLIIVEVELRGKKYRFIFDSGATNAVSKELADELHLKPVLDQTAEDASGIKNGVKFAVLDTIKMGSLLFLGTGAAIIDLKGVPEIACMQVDGLIGANLMRKAKWQIDYMKKEMTVADDIKKLNVPADAFVIPFSPMLSGTPVITVEAGGKKCGGNIFDLGSTGTVMLTEKFRQQLIKGGVQFPSVKGVGSNSSGLYGMVPDTSFTARLSLRTGTLPLDNYVVDFRKNKNGNFGSGLFKDYIVTMDWERQKIFFSPQPKTGERKWATFGFVPVVKQGKLVISFLYDGSPAKEAGVIIGDQVISIDGKDYTNVSASDYCEMIRGNSPWKLADSIKMIIRPASGGPDREVILDKRDILSK